MTQSQRRFAEIPLLLLILWCVQALEISVLRLPLNAGAVHLMPVLITYVALTRSWGMLGLLSFAFAFMGSSTIAYPAGIYIAVQMWTALVTKGFVKAFALEGRTPFTVLAVSSHVVAKIITFLCLLALKMSPPVGHSVLHLVGGAASTALLAWFLFPPFVAWDSYFEHEADEARELNPTLLR